MSNSETKMGMFGGVSLSVLGQMPSNILQTVLLAALGACVSFFVSRILQWLSKIK
ncbi:hypothetical protein [Pedobacter sp. Leaf132]|uniref:hypothetical protein n=1 Tax=Pedobacter sp. Leaf132 TaxID=2876557 RepID=UPI001E49D8F7|nr:hypothetical protein [Pedobacter sp. Leaf132]